MTNDSTRKGSPNFKGIVSILLIDDEPSVIFALRLLLEALGFKVQEFCKAEEALTSIKHGAFYDLCICDLKMPKMNGLQVLEASRALAPNLPFILMSAHASTEEVDKALSLGAFGFLAKPFTPEQLMEIVKRCEERTV